jgi:hypothetical protein
MHLFWKQKYFYGFKGAILSTLFFKTTHTRVIALQWPRLYQEEESAFWPKMETMFLVTFLHLCPGQQIA